MNIGGFSGGVNGGGFSGGMNGGGFSGGMNGGGFNAGANNGQVTTNSDYTVNTESLIGKPSSYFQNNNTTGWNNAGVFGGNTYNGFNANTNNILNNYGYSGYGLQLQPTMVYTGKEFAPIVENMNNIDKKSLRDDKEYYEREAQYSAHEKIFFENTEV